MPVNVDTILPELKSILTEELNVNLEPGLADEDVLLLEDGLGLDSIVLVDLIGIVENRFGFQFQDADLRTASFRSLRTLADVIAQRMSA